MRPKIGFLVRDLGPSQLSWEIIAGAKGSGADVVAFCERAASPCVEPGFPALSHADAWGYDGALVATSLATAAILKNVVGPRAKAFFVWELEWTRRAMDHALLAPLYRDPPLLMARPGHAAVVAAAWNRPVVAAPGPHARFVLEAMGQ